MKNTIYFKALSVIASCKTSEHVRVTYVWIKLAYKNGNLSIYSFAFLVTVCFDKWLELDKLKTA